MIFSLTEVKAINKELITKDDNITMPLTIWSTGSTIEVKNTTDYTLYAQWLEISKEKYDEINANVKECNDLVTEANKYASENRPDKNNYPEDDAGYNKAVQEYNAKIQEYQNKNTTCINKYYESVPDFDDDKWQELVDNKVYLPEASYSGNKPFVLFVKLDDRTNSLTDYEFAILEIENNSKDTSVNNSDVSNFDENVEEISEQLNTSNNDSVTENPKTGNEQIAFVFGGTLLLIILIAYIIKIQKNKKIYKI